MVDAKKLWQWQVKKLKQLTFVTPQILILLFL